mmetsp:Transcript_9164/g.21011  ORF Transcript_9164/g.21011 Transcript_9164/m.21011 type:complete len:97 (+) Transcript_9164:378-668(+)
MVILDDRIVTAYSMPVPIGSWIEAGIAWKNSLKIDQGGSERPIASKKKKGKSKMIGMVVTTFQRNGRNVTAKPDIKLVCGVNIRSSAVIKFFEGPT